MYDVNLQPITSESNIPFKKVLLLSNGKTVSTGILKGINANGEHQFTFTSTSCGVDGTIQTLMRTIDEPTHYAILTITLQYEFCKNH